MGSEKEIFEHWDPREEDYKNPTFSTYKEGPGKNSSRSLSSSGKGNSTEPIGLYIRYVPLNFPVESLTSLLGKYGSIVSTRILGPNKQHQYSTTTVAIVKVKSMMDALSVIENVNKKPPLNLKVELALTHGDKMQTNISTVAPPTSNQTKPIVTGHGITENGSIQHQQTANSPVKHSAGRGKLLLKSEERNIQELRKPGQIKSSTSGLMNSPKEREGCSSQSAESVSLSHTPSTTSVIGTQPASSGAKVVSNGLLPLRPPNCIRCNYLGSKRCSVCKAWYCSKKCQEDDWYYHREKCEPPPPLEDVLLDALGLQENEPLSIPTDHRDDVVWPRMVKYIERKITSPGEISSDPRVQTTKVEEFSRARPMSLTNGKELFEGREQIQLPDDISQTLDNPVFETESHQRLKKEAQIHRVIEFLAHTQKIPPNKVDEPQEQMPNNPLHKTETSYPKLNGFPIQKQDILSHKNDMVTNHLLENSPHEVPDAASKVRTSTECTQQTSLLKIDKVAESRQQTTPPKLGSFTDPKLPKSPPNLGSFTDPKLPKTSLKLGSFTDPKQPKTPPKLQQMPRKLGSFTDPKQQTTPPKLGSLTDAKLSKTSPKLGSLTDAKLSKTPPKLRSFTDAKQPTIPPKLESLADPKQQTSPKLESFADPKQQTTSPKLESFTDHKQQTPNKIGPIEESKCSISPSKVHLFKESMDYMMPTQKDRSNDCTQTSLDDEKIQSFSNVFTHLEPESIFDAVVTLSKFRESFFVMLLNDFANEILLTHPKKLESGESLLISHTKIGDFVMALSPSDNAWYRAMVCQLPKPHSAKVCYIDFGNDELVTTMKTIPKSLDTISIPGLALKTTLHSDLPTEKVSKFETLIKQDAQITFRLIEKNEQSVCAMMLDEGKKDIALFILQPCVFSCLEEIGQSKVDLNSQAQTKSENKVAHKNEESGVQNKKIFYQDLRTKLVEIGKVYTVTPTWLEQDALYIQEYSTKEMHLMQHLICTMEQHCNKACQPCNLLEGELVCAFVSEDDTWYRGQITAVDEKQKQATLYFFDFGNTDSIAFENLRTFEPSLATIPIMALNLKPISPNGKPASYKQMQAIMKPYIENSLTFLVEVEEVEPLRAKLMDMNKVPLLKTPIGLSKPETCATAVVKSPEPDAVTLLKSGSVKPLLTMYDECESTSLPLENGVEVVILQPTNPLNIFLIAKAHVNLFEKLEALSTEMNKYCNSLETTYYIPKDGEVCLAKYASDGLWYRAAAISVDDKSALVIFVDYGNTETVPFRNLCQMVDRFIELPLFALHCQLKGFTLKELEESNGQLEAALHKIIPPFSTLTINVLSKCEESFIYIIEIPSLPSDELRQKIL